MARASSVISSLSCRCGPDLICKFCRMIVLLKMEAVVIPEAAVGTGERLDTDVIDPTVTARPSADGDSAVTIETFRDAGPAVGGPNAGASTSTCDSSADGAAREFAGDCAERLGGRPPVIPFRGDGGLLRFELWCTSEPLPLPRAGAEPCRTKGGANCIELVWFAPVGVAELALFTGEDSGGGTGSGGAALGVIYTAAAVR
mmetsp:Transcript_60459/g.197871  ORF Transcript_60459/g.197871 Transcript_60459/m.197871 type:complete len:201 (+) Transcript_60459:1903-2505(+)